jgi:uncharacterized protein GlcG (DUF336 family)
MNVSLTEANDVLEGARAAARRMGIAVNIAVLDSGAHLKAFARMDGSILGSIDVALKKAKTAALFEATTEQVREYSKPGGPAQWLEVTNEVLVTFPGGIPLRDETGEMIGAVGVSGGSVEQDRAIATAGAAALGRTNAPVAAG